MGNLNKQDTSLVRNMTVVCKISHLSGSGRVDHVVGTAVFSRDRKNVTKFVQEFTYAADHQSSMITNESVRR